MRIAILIFVSCVMTLGSIARAKETVVPAVVHKAFSSQYGGGVLLKKWSRVGDTLIAKFKTNREMHLAYYLCDGSWIKTQTRLRWTWNLPVCIRYSFSHTRFAPWSIDDISFIESTGKDYYSISVFLELGPEGSIPGDNVDRYILYFYPDGTNFKTDHVG